MAKGEIRYNAHKDRLEIQSPRGCQPLSHGERIELRIGRRWTPCVVLYDGGEWHVELAEQPPDIHFHGLEAQTI